MINVYFPAVSKLTSYLNFKILFREISGQGVAHLCSISEQFSAEVDKLTFMSSIAVSNVCICVCARLLSLQTIQESQTGTRHNKMNYVLA